MQKTTSETTVAEILNLTAPIQEGATTVQAVGLGRDAYALVVQGSDAIRLMEAFLTFGEQLHTSAHSENKAAPGEA